MGVLIRDVPYGSFPGRSVGENTSSTIHLNGVGGLAAAEEEPCLPCSVSIVVFGCLLCSVSIVVFHDSPSSCEDRRAADGHRVVVKVHNMTSNKLPLTEGKLSHRHSSPNSYELSNFGRL